ncbi:flagellar biosynthesis anti-sigma factor FlgM [Methylotenera sp.]|uniref:flagellar biosynthesis anti-sigma factor FlgM n=2 Tax=Methylotenera sp. TaxID=2051956 RepID=UPI00272F1498|nr:flagellar biosynthesis anti-sigma factor FlgM [Methylotenera sp.]MDP2072232.1 flagellar biosynthesis anti-sigma factor FlgM [Methylotenera sp.]MDP3005031.1 flagellar biosynthesis anti-sigma factor FlgM [Methylotenera sp.]
MKINDSIKNVAAVGADKSSVDKAGAGKLDSAGKNAQAAQVDIKPAESVTLSPLSAQLKSLEAKVASSSVFDAEKVDAIKSAIASGQFKVDAEKVADGLIATVKDLLTTQKS